MRISDWSSDVCSSDLKRQALDVTNGAADLAENEILAVQVGLDEFLDGVRDVRDHLHRRAQIVAAPFASQDGGIDPARRHAVAAPRRAARVALVMPAIQLVLGPLLGDEDLPGLGDGKSAG